VLRCGSGTVWLTCGDGRDYLLGAGTAFEIKANQVAVAEALQPVECSIVMAAASPNLRQSPVIRFAAC
jgi:hypothetical protein